ncbi:hypothetical protein [Pseudoalteromonas sp. Ld20]|uniref:hypothetical protein n=1 Tax=Pseudoalteromonas sp. Ld20 TaxID=649165 RepID=UPI00386B235D
MKTQIKFINHSMNKSLPHVFIFAESGMHDFNPITDGIAWRVLKNVGRGSVASLIYEPDFTIRAGWNNGADTTRMLLAEVGKQYQIIEDNTGVILEKSGNAATKDIIELVNNIQVDSGVSAQLCNGGKAIIGKKIVGYQQSAIFKPSNKLYWGLASEISEGKGLASKSVVLNSNRFFELDLSGVAEVLVSLNGNAKDGYHFQVEQYS